MIGRQHHSFFLLQFARTLQQIRLQVTLANWYLQFHLFNIIDLKIINNSAAS